MAFGVVQVPRRFGALRWLVMVVVPVLGVLVVLVVLVVNESERGAAYGLRS